MTLTGDQNLMVGSIDRICRNIVTDEYSAEIDRAARYPIEVMDALWRRVRPQLPFRPKLAVEERWRMTSSSSTKHPHATTS